MLLYITFIAVFNLAFGYAIGSGIISPTGIPQVPLGSLLSKLKRSKTTGSEEASSSESTIPDIGSDEAFETDDNHVPTQEELVAGLAGFREKLTNASLELKLSQEDPERFESCANKLQSVNHDYIAHTNEVISSFDGTEASESAGRDSLVENAKEAKKLSDQVDEILHSEMSEDTRQQLITTSEEIRDGAIEIEQIKNKRSKTTKNPSKIRKINSRMKMPKNWKNCNKSFVKNLPLSIN